MSNMFKRVRIVHSPKEQHYTVEERGLFSWRWNRVWKYDYVETRHYSPYGTNDLASEAMAKAVGKAEILLARAVVWEK